MSQTYDLTEGKVSSLIIKFFFPMFFTNMLQQVYTIADTAIVGKGLGDDALAAVGNMSSLTFLIFGFSLGLANGFSIMTAQHYGAHDYEKMRKAVASSVVLSAIMSVVLTVLSVVFLKPVLIAMQTSDIIIDDSLVYGYILFGGLITSIAYNMCACVLRALGDSKTPLKAIIVSTVLNIVLNSVFIFIFKTGVGGAAAATIISQVVSAIICFDKLRKIEILKLSASDFKVESEIYITLIRNGVPMACMNSITAVGCMVVQYFVNGLGVAYTSAYSACSKYINLCIQPACTAGFVMSSFTGQNYGAKKYDRIKEGLKVCLTIALISYVLLGSLMVFLPKTLAGTMLNGSEPIEYAAQFFPICGAMLFLVDFLFIFRSGVQGMGYPFIPMCSGIVEMVMRIAVIVMFIGEAGFRATAYAEVVAWFGAIVLNIIAFAVILRKKLYTQKDENIKFKDVCKRNEQMSV